MGTNIMARNYYSLLFSLIVFSCLFLTIQSFIVVNNSLYEYEGASNGKANPPQEKGCDCKRTENGMKHSECKYGYSDQLGGCCYCDCGPNSISCEYDGCRKICTCKKGYAQTYVNGEITCKECDCGVNSIQCWFPEPEWKACTCKTGYVQERNAFGAVRCRECDCGENSYRCGIDYKGNKNCECFAGLVALNDADLRKICQTCDCGPNSTDCGADENGYKICTCKEGYSAKTKSLSDKHQECVEDIIIQDEIQHCSDWKLPFFGVLGVSSALISILLIYVFYMKKKNRKRFQVTHVATELK